MKVDYRLLLTGAWLCAAVSFASPPDSLGSVVITARREQKGLTTAVPYRKLTADDFRVQGVTRTSDALRRLAGVGLRDYGGAGGLLTVNVRGLGAAHTVVTVDGFPSANGEGGEVDLQRYDIDRIASVSLFSLDNPELLCPVGSLGAATLDFAERKDDQRATGVHGGVSLIQSAFSSYEGEGKISGTTKKGIALYGHLSYLTSRNDYPFFVENGKASETLRRANSELRKTNAAAGFSWPLKNGKLSAKAAYHHNYRRLPGPVVFYVNENNERLTEEDGYARIHYRGESEKWRYFAAARYDRGKRLYTDIRADYPSGVLRQNYYTEAGYLTAGAAYRIFPCLEAAYSTDLTISALHSNLSTASSVKRLTSEQALSVRFRLGDWEITGRGLLRYFNDHTESPAITGGNLRLTPSLTTVYRLIDRPRFSLRLRGGYKESYRSPSFSEAYFYHYGSRSLRPELARQLSSGLTLSGVSRNGAEAAVTADAYYNRVTNRIVSIPYNLYIWQTINLGRVDIKGMDLTISATLPLTPRHRLRLHGNHSFQVAADRTKKGSAGYGKQLAYTPRHAGTASLAWLNPWADIVVQTSFSSERYSTIEHLPQTRMPAYSEWGFGVSKEIIVKKHRLFLSADLINAFNKHYEIVRRYPMPGRAYRIKVSWNF